LEPFEAVKSISGDGVGLVHAMNKTDADDGKRQGFAHVSKTGG
jgi:hypothetical protein